MSLELSAKLEKIVDFEKQISNFFNIESEFKVKLENIKKKVVKPDHQGYIYFGFFESFLEKKEIFVILRKNINEEIILEIENQKNEHFFVNFKNIVKIEKSKKNINRVKITQRSIFNKVIIIEFDKRSSFYEDLKKFWLIFISIKEKIQEKDNEKIDNSFLNSIKNIIIN